MANKKNQAEEISAQVEETTAEEKVQEVAQEVPEVQKEPRFRERVIALQTELKAPKSRYNSFGKYAYRSCEDIVEAVKPLCQKYGLLLNLSDSVEMVGSRFYVKAFATLSDMDTIEFEDGTYTTDQVCSVGWAREDEGKKGMDGSQITGTASSYARKYALNGLLLIDDTKDADTDEYAKQNGGKKTDYFAEISKFRNIADLEIWWNANLDDLKAQPNYKEIFAFASNKGKELNAQEGRV